jgi:hypothetical protein
MKFSKEKKKVWTLPPRRTHTKFSFS